MEIKELRSSCPYWAKQSKVCLSVKLRPGVCICEYQAKFGRDWKPIRVVYDWQGADHAVGLIHPMKDMETRGVKVLSYQSDVISQCSLMDIDRMPDPCPEYIRESNHQYL